MHQYDPDAGCPKCGSKDIYDRYEPELAKGVGDRISRKCRNCGYHWTARPLDYMGEKDVPDKR